MSDLEEVTGILMTRIDCPECGEVFDVEGDAAGDEVQCGVCGAKYHVERTM